MISFGYKAHQKTVIQNAIQKQKSYINDYFFPSSINKTLLVSYPHLEADDIELVIKGLREYFHLCNIAGKTMVAMPSQVVDIAWHDFILFTREYELFCQQALGRFLHHTPAEAMSRNTVAQNSIKTAWKISCEREEINPLSPKKLPLLFALDAMLKIEDGFEYSLDCSTKNGAAYCGGHIGCSGGSGDIGSVTDGSDSSIGSSVDGSVGCGGGCGGS